MWPLSLGNIEHVQSRVSIMNDYTWINCTTLSRRTLSRICKLAFSNNRVREQREDPAVYKEQLDCREQRRERKLERENVVKSVWGQSWERERQTDRRDRGGRNLALTHITAARVPAEKYGSRPWHWSLRLWLRSCVSIKVLQHFKTKNWKIHPGVSIFTGMP